MVYFRYATVWASRRIAGCPWRTLMSNQCGWEHFSHGADIGIRGTGASLAESFEQAAMALTAAVTDPASVNPDTEVEIHCEEDDRELLFVDWLNAVIYEMTTRNMLFSRYHVVIEGRRLTATATGENIDWQRHQPAVEPKGATYTELKVAQLEDGRWLSQCIVDV
jgi:SHS2 domain-containing protein